MELEEMKTQWTEMSAELDKQKKLTDVLIIKMTKVNYRNRINRIVLPEAIGSMVCVAAMLYIIINIQMLDTWYLMGCGVMTILILGILSFMSFRATRKLGSVNIQAHNYKESLLTLSKGKLQLVFHQKLTFYLGAVLFLVTLPVMGKLMGGVDPFKTTRLWYLYALGFPFFYWFAHWVFKSYRKTLWDAENILRELDVN